MFNITTRPTFVRDVPVDIPHGDGHRTEHLRTTFVALYDDEDAPASGDKLRAFLERCVERFDDLADDDGNEIPFSPDVKGDLLARPYVRMALLREYLRSMSGAKSGN